MRLAMDADSFQPVSCEAGSLFFGRKAEPGYNIRSMKTKRLVQLAQFFALKPRALLQVPTIRRIRGYTMQTISRVYQMYDHIRELDKAGVKGAIVETGCWKGGLGAYMALSAKGRETWLFDSFEGLPEMTEKDAEIVQAKKLEFNKKTGYIAVSETIAREIADELGAAPHIVKGWFSDSLPRHKKEIGPIAILRLDGDTYSSTMEALDALYDSVAEGGLVVVDDYYDFRGCREALYRFFNKRDINPALEEYPFGRAYFRKKSQ